MIAEKLSLFVPALRHARHALADVLFLAGLGLVAFGISRWSVPCGLIFSGIAVAYVGLMLSRD